MKILLMQDVPDIINLDKIKVEAYELDLKIKYIEELYQEIME